MKKRKLIALLSAGVMAVSLLAGCGGSSSNSGSAKGSNSANSQAKTSTSKEASSAKASGEKYNTKALENAGDITITMMLSGTATENDFETEQLPKLVKEKWPNALADAGYLASLNDMDLLSNMKDLAAVTRNDKVVSATVGVAILGTYYNKDLFKANGITEEPKTWAEFLEDCKKLKDAGIQPIVMGDKDQYVLQFGLYQIAANEIYSKDANYDEKLRTGETKFTDKDTWDKVLEMYKTLYDNKYIDSSQSLGYGASQAIQSFIDGKAAMTFDGSFNSKALLAEGAGGKFERGYFPIPSESGERYTATCLGGGYSIYSKSKHIDECKELLDYWLNGKADNAIWNAYLATGRVIPSFGEGADKIPNYDLYKPFIDLMNQGKAFHWCNQAWPAGTEGTMEELFSEMVGGQGAKVEDITKGMQEKFEDLLDE